MVWAGCFCSSSLIRAAPRLGEHRQLPWTPKGNSGVNRQTKPNADLNFTFPQLNWYSSMGRVCRSPGLPWEGDNFVGCKIKQFCHVIFFFFLWALPWVVFILPLPVKGLFNMWGCTADWASCALFYHLIAPSQVTEDSWILGMCLCLGTCFSWQSWAVALVIFLHVSPQDISSLLSKVPSKLIERLDVPRSYRNGAT